MNKICKDCGQSKEIEKFVKRTKDTYRNQCKECHNLKKRKTPVKPTPKEGHKYCAACGEEKSLDTFNVRCGSHYSYCKPCEREKDSKRYSHKCETCGKEYHTGRKDSKICANCHRDLMKENKVMYKYKKRDFSGEKNPMYGKQRFGDENPNYKHNLSNTERYKKRLFRGYGLWREQVYERDNYTCQCCNKPSNGDIEAHHKDGYSWCIERRMDVSNGVTLCKGCHAGFHKIYGKFDVTEQQFYEYKRTFEHR